MQLRTRKVRPSPGQSRNPFEIWIMVSIMAWAVGIAAFGPPAAGVTLTLYEWTRYAVAVIMFVGAGTCFISIFHPDEVRSALVELFGLVGIIGPLAIYVGNLALNVRDIHAALQVGAIAFLLVCCVHRVLDVYGWLAALFPRWDWRKWRRWRRPDAKDDPG